MHTHIFILKYGSLSNKNKTYKEFNMRLSLGNLCKIDISMFNSIWEKVLSSSYSKVEFRIL